MQLAPSEDGHREDAEQEQETPKPAACRPVNPVVRRGRKGHDGVGGHYERHREGIAVIPRRVSALVAAAALAAVLVPASSTDSTFTDTEVAASAVTAIVVPAPVIDTCTASSVLVSLSLVPRVELTWPYGTGGYVGADARYYNSSVGAGNLAPVALGNGVSTTGPVSGTFTTTFQGSLLGGLLGGSGDVGVAAANSSGWRSLISSARATFPLLIGTGGCTITNA
ncbi:hypothetical protein E3O06_00295 [Cryobacterium glaciale]|uniref:Uncharacterized protein n=1 Tax=Cryobacterium glaciale TaxID=1259145 RepID=A0A4R8V6V6_9MICO|nr:hypothetical protein [Cryobacterium glaciale]TFB77241.1 hypothetical protein E3O06_00295 [Cryobacterium glaciale]